MQKCEYDSILPVTLEHPEGGTLNPDECDIPLNSASYYSLWGHFFVASGHMISCEKSTDITFILGLNEIKANRPVPYQNVCKRFAHDQSSWVVTGVKKIQELI